MKPDALPQPSKPAVEPGAVTEASSVRAEDARLVERARAGDAAAFRRLVERHRDRAYGLALRILRAPADAEEVAQDAFVRVWGALARFRGDAAFSTWLYRIVARLAFARAASLRGRSSREVELAGEPGPAEPAEAPGGVGEAARQRRLERLVGGLPEAQRAVVTLYYYGDRSVEDVARTLGMNENTVKTHLSRARSTLRAAWLHREGGARP